jgi:hypothetical protein
MNSLLTLPMKANADLISTRNAIPLEAEDIAQAISAAIEACNSGESYLWSSIGTAIKLFFAAPHKGRAVIFRLQALAMILEGNELKNWMQPDGSQIVPGAQKALIAAVAYHPLSLVDGAISFERESFFQRILEFSELPGGQKCC